jgi:hypothetical protein
MQEHIWEKLAFSYKTSVPKHSESYLYYSKYLCFPWACLKFIFKHNQENWVVEERRQYGMVIKNLLNLWLYDWGQVIQLLLSSSFVL